MNPIFIMPESGGIKMLTKLNEEINQNTEMTHEPISLTKDTPVRVDKIVDYVIDEQEREHTVCVGIAYQEYFRRNKIRVVLSIDCFTLDPKHVEAIPSFDDQVRDKIRERLGEETEFQHDKIIMI